MLTRGKGWLAAAAAFAGLAAWGIVDYYQAERVKWLENAPVGALEGYVRRTPDDHEAGFRLAHRLTALGRGEDARKIMETLVRADSENFTYWFGLARTAGASGDPLRAEEAYLQAIRISPRAYEPQSILGQLYLDAGLLEEAQERMETAVRLHPPDETLLSQWALCLAGLGRDEEAWDRLVQSLAAIPHQELPYLLLGELALRLKREAEAVPLFERRMGLSLAYPTGVARAPLARMLIRLRKPGWREAAEAFARKAVRDPSPRPEFDAALAEVLLATGKPAEALAAAEAGLRRDGGHAPCLRMAAQALEQLGRRAEGTARLRQIRPEPREDPALARLWAAVQRPGAPAAAHLALAKALRSMGHEPEAARAAWRGLRAVPNDPELTAVLREARRAAIGALSSKRAGAMRNAGLMPWAD